MTRSKFNIDFLPNDFQQYILDEIKKEKIYFKLSSPRKSKLGDYRFFFQSERHAITINIDLSPIQFLITFVHELAHKKCYDLFKGRVASHGSEWKLIFSDLLIQCKNKVCLDQSQLSILHKCVENPRANSSNTDVVEQGDIVVSDLPLDTKFTLKNGRSFKVLNRRRTRFLCSDLKNGNLYAVSENAIVETIL
jgi:predicted SprT family Zn-dependent metalloprotease